MSLRFQIFAALVFVKVATATAQETATEPLAYSNQCFEWGSLERSLKGGTLCLDGSDDQRERNQITARSAIETAFEGARMGEELEGAGVGACARDADGRFVPLAGHYVVWRNYTTDLWIFVAPLEADGDVVASGMSSATEVLNRRMSSEELGCIYPDAVQNAEPEEAYNVRVFPFTADVGDVLRIGVETGPRPGNEDPVTQSEIDAFNHALAEEETIPAVEKEKHGPLDEGVESASKGSAASESQRSGESTSKKTAAGENGDSADGDSDGSAASEGDGNGVLPPAAPPWLSNLAQMFLKSYGLDSYGQFGALALMALAPDVLESLAEFSSKLTEGLADDDLDKVMAALHEAYKIGAALSELESSLANIAKAGEGGFAAALEETARQIRDMPPELREQLSLELNEDAQRIAEAASLLNAENLKNIEGVFDDPSNLERLADEATDRARPHVENVVIEAAVDKLQDELGIPLDPALARGLYSGELELTERTVGRLLLDQVAEEAGLSSTDMEDILDGELGAVAERRLEADVSREIRSAMASTGVDPGLAALIGVGLSTDDASGMEDAMVTATVEALPPGIREPARLLAAGDKSIRDQALVDVVLSRAGEHAGAGAARALFVDGDVSKAAEEATLYLVRTELSPELAPPGVGFSELSAEALAKFEPGTSSERELYLDVYAAIVSGDSDALGRLRDHGERAVAREADARFANLDADILVLAKKVIAAASLRSGSDTAGIAEAVKDSVSLAATMAVAASNLAEIDMMIASLEGEPTWKVDLLAGLATKNVEGVRVAALAGLSDAGSLGDMTTAAGERVLEEAIRRSAVAEALVGDDAGAIADAILAGDPSIIANLAEEKLDSEREKLEQGIGNRSIIGVAEAALARAPLEDLTSYLPEPFDHFAMMAQTLEDPAAAALGVLGNEIGTPGRELFALIVDGASEVDASFAREVLESQVDPLVADFLLAERDLLELAGEVIQAGLAIDLESDLDILVPEMTGSPAEVAEALGAMTVQRRLDLFGFVSDSDVAELLLSWPNAGAREEALGNWVAQRLEAGGFPSGRLPIDVLFLALRRDGAMEPEAALALRKANSLQDAGFVLSSRRDEFARDAPLSIAVDAALEGRLGRVLVATRGLAGFADAAAFRSASATTAEAAAESEFASRVLGPDFGWPGSDLDLALALQDADARAIFLSAVETRSVSYVAKLEDEARHSAADILAMAAVEDPIALALNKLPPHLHPVGMALIENGDISTAARNAAVAIVGEAIGLEAARLLFDGAATVIATLDSGDPDTVDLALAIARKSAPAVLSADVDSLEKLAEVEDPILVDLLEASDDESGDVVVALVAAALDSTVDNLAFLDAAVRDHLGSTLRDVGARPDTLGFLRIVQDVQATLAPEQGADVERLRSADDAPSFQLAVVSLDQELYERAFARLVEAEVEPFVLDSLLLAREGRLDAAWALSNPLSLDQEIVALALDVAAAALAEERAALLLLGQDIGTKVRDLARLVQSGGDIPATTIDPEPEDVAARAGNAAAIGEWNTIKKRLEAVAGQDDVDAVQALREAARSGTPVPAATGDSAMGLMRRAGFSRREADLLLTGDPRGIAGRRIAELSADLAPDPRVSMAAETPVAALRVLLEPLILAQVAANATSTAGLNSALNGATAVATGDCLRKVECREEAEVLLRSALDEAELQAWLEGPAEAMTETAEAVLRRLLCPAGTTCNWRRADRAVGDEIIATSRESLGSNRDVRELFAGETEGPTRRREEMVRTEIASTANTAARTTLADDGVDLDGSDPIASMIATVQENGEDNARPTPPLDDFWDRKRRVERYATRGALAKTCLRLGLGDRGSCIKCPPDTGRGRGQTCESTSDEVAVGRAQ